MTTIPTIMSFMLVFACTETEVFDGSAKKNQRQTAVLQTIDPDGQDPNGTNVDGRANARGNGIKPNDGDLAEGPSERDTAELPENIMGSFLVSCDFAKGDKDRALSCALINKKTRKPLNLNTSGRVAEWSFHFAESARKSATIKAQNYQDQSRYHVAFVFADLDDSDAEILAGRVSIILSNPKDGSAETGNSEPFKLLKLYALCSYVTNAAVCSFADGENNGMALAAKDEANFQVIVDPDGKPNPILRAVKATRRDTTFTLDADANITALGGNIQVVVKSEFLTTTYGSNFNNQMLNFGDGTNQYTTACDKNTFATARKITDTYNIDFKLLGAGPHDVKIVVKKLCGLQLADTTKIAVFHLEDRTWTKVDETFLPVVKAQQNFIFKPKNMVGGDKYQLRFIFIDTKTDQDDYFIAGMDVLW